VFQKPGNKENKRGKIPNNPTQKEISQPAKKKGLSI